MDQISSQIVSLEGEKYAIPQENLRELVRITAADVKNKIEKVGSVPVIRLRQKLLPLLDLADVLGVQKTYLTADREHKADKRKEIADRRSVQHLAESTPADMASERAVVKRQENDRRTNPDSAVNIAIVFSESYTYGLIVDKLHDSEKITILPVGRFLARCHEYMGTTILKTGRAALVLDILNIAHKTGLSSAAHTVNDVVSESFDEDPGLDTFSLLTFRNSDTEYFAVNLDSVERLERFKSSDFEKIGKDEIIQYRGGALPVFELSEVLPCSPLTEKEFQDVIVFRSNDNLSGLKVVPPVDAIECSRALDKSTFNKPPVMGSMIINDKTTLILDVSKMVNAIKDKGHGKNGGSEK